MRATKTPAASPSKNRATFKPPTRLPHTLPAHLHWYLNAQKRAILHSLRNPSDVDTGEDAEHEEDTPTNAVAFRQLNDMLHGTVMRNEGNSCLLIGPRGSGKSHVRDIIAATDP